jgi:hypothetical protein
MNNHLSAAIYTILKPIIGLLFHQGVSFGELSSLAKKAYVDVTEKELLKSGQRATISMIAISTGLTRKEVSFIKKETISLPRSNQRNRAIRVISGWISDPEFSQGSKAKTLNLQGKHGSFEQLVSRYSGDIPYKAMMKELLRIGAAEQQSKHKITLVQAAYIPSGDENQKYDFLGEDTASMISTIAHNIIAHDEEPFFQRKVRYNKIPEECLGEFKKLANKEGQELLTKLNRWLSRYDMDQHPEIKDQNPTTVGVGVYYFESNTRNKVSHNAEH